MRAAVYCRLSKEDEVLPGSEVQESESIQNQRAMLLEYARQHGHEVTHIYCDEDYSGIDRTRPDFNRMLEAARAGEFELILVKTQSRFTRDMELVEKYLHGLFPLWGIRFIAVVDHVDTFDDANKKSRQINGLINEWYLDDLSANVRSVLTHKRRAGQYIAAFPLYGYAKDPADHNRLVIDPEAAGVVRRIFGLYLSGLGTTRIAQTLNRENLPPPGVYRRLKESNTPYYIGVPRETWSKSTIHRLLTTRTYAGDLEQGRHRRISYKSCKTVWIPRSQWIVVPGTHPAIIDRETFDRVQQMLHSGARSSTGGSVHPLAGRVVCGLCGRVMEQTASGRRGADGSRTRYFRCRTALRDRTLCPGQPYLPVAALETAVLARIRALLGPYLDPEDPSLCPPGPDEDAAEREKRHLHTELELRRAAVEALYLDRCGGVVEEEEFQTLHRRFRQEITRLEQRLHALESAPAPESASAARQRRLRQAAALPVLDRALVSLMVDRIRVFPPENGTRRVEIDWNF